MLYLETLWLLYTEYFLLGNERGIEANPSWMGQVS